MEEISFVLKIKQQRSAKSPSAETPLQVASASPAQVLAQRSGC